MAFRRLRVLLRQFVPRHSSSALFSLLYAALTESLDALLLLYVAFKELVFLLHAHSFFSGMDQRRREVIPFHHLHVKDILNYLQK